MNYIAEIRAFYDWVESNPSISASCISLWHGLMYQANKAGWKPEFSVAISTLELRTGLKRGAIYRARNTLKQCNVIDFKERDGNQSAVYRVNSLCLFNEHNRDTTRNTIATQPGTQQRHNPELLLNINETKRNETNNTPSCPPSGDGGGKQKRSPKKDMPAKTQYAEFVSMTNDEYSSLVAKVGDQGVVECVEILDNYKGASGKKYTSDYRAILSWVIKRREEEQVRQQVQQDKQIFNGGHKETQNERNNRLLNEYFSGGETVDAGRIEVAFEYDVDQL